MNTMCSSLRVCGVRVCVVVCVCVRVCVCVSVRGRPGDGSSPATLGDDIT